ncbi:hypothetical protein EDD16DRAFT_170576 [Pisolithus croceorrhizus]|nr:hypothetical protein EDD16DRAFT_170576 [Pisolithus croceorrhizus]
MGINDDEGCSPSPSRLSRSGLHSPSPRCTPRSHVFIEATVGRGLHRQHQLPRNTSAILHMDMDFILFNFLVIYRYRTRLHFLIHHGHATARGNCRSWHATDLVNTGRSASRPPHATNSTYLPDPFLASHIVGYQNAQRFDCICTDSDAAPVAVSLGKGLAAKQFFRSLDALSVTFTFPYTVYNCFPFPSSKCVRPGRTSKRGCHRPTEYRGLCQDLPYILAQ